MSGVLLVPTLNRIELLKRFVESYIDAESSVQTVLLVDAVDYAANEAGYKSIVFPESMQIVNTHEAVTMGDKCRFIFDKLESIQPGLRWVGLLNDDHYIVTKGWDRTVEELIDGKNFISTNDGYWMAGCKVCGLTAWSIDLLKVAGFPIYPEKMHHLYIDDLWKAVGESTGSWLETMRINIEHRHVLRGDMQADETFIKSNSEPQYRKAEPIFKDFMENRFKDVCLNIIKFRSEETLDAKFV